MSHFNPSMIDRCKTIPNLDLSVALQNIRAPTAKLGTTHLQYQSKDSPKLNHTDEVTTQNVIFSQCFIDRMKGFRGARGPNTHWERALLAGDGALGLPEGGGPLPLQLLRLLGLLLPLGQDLNTTATLINLKKTLYCRRDKFVPVYSSVVDPDPPL